jgi:hypothetical protein
MLWLKKYFRRKKVDKKLTILTHNTAILYKQIFIALVFKKLPIFCRKLVKIGENCVIITLTPGVTSKK